MISSRLAIPDWSSILAMIRAGLFMSERRRRRMSMSSASRTKDSAKIVDLLLDADRDVGPVLCGEGRQADLDAREG